jgi:Ca2+-binding RTX toxin-like protein
VGGGGADVLVGGPGDDELSVGAGRDAVRYGPLTDVVLDGGKPHPDAGLGTDVLRDAGGFDTLDFAGFPERVVIDLGDDAVQVVDPPSLFEQRVLPSREAPPAPRLRVRLEPANGGASFESVIGSEHGDVLTGTSAANRLEGRGGNDVIEGGGGRDSIVGGAGTDQCSNAGQLVLCEAPPLVTAPQAGALLP